VTTLWTCDICFIDIFPSFLTTEDGIDLLLLKVCIIFEFLVNVTDIWTCLAVEAINSDCFFNEE
jgi:hypothetical protein